MVSARQNGASGSGKVQITVRDKIARRTEVFYCPLPILMQGMKYFQPIIQKQLDEQRANPKAESSEKESDGPVIALKVNCSTEIFRWLLAYMKKEGPKFSDANAVSIVLSSHFLRMDELTDIALEYVRDNLANVLVSGVDMDCIPGELLGRFCTITREYHVASALLELYDRGEEDHAGRSFLSTVARHLAMIRLSGKAGMASSKRRWDHSSSVSTGMKGKDEMGGGVSGTYYSGQVTSSTSGADKTEKMPLDNGLRWCRLCGVLYDSAGIQRLLLSGKSTEPPCEALTNNIELRMGPRGEVFTTHVSSDAPVSISPPSTWDAPQIERWAWQVIGSILLVICTVCHCPCSLIEAIAHRCPNAQFTTEEPGFGNAEMDVILRWLQLSMEERVQQGEANHLIPLRASRQESSALEVESIVMPRHRSAKGKVDAANRAGSSVDRTVPFTWQGQPSRVSEVALGYDAGIDVDLLSFYERKMMAQLIQCRSEEAPQKPSSRLRLTISAQNGQPLSYVPPSADERYSGSAKGPSSRQRQGFASTVGGSAAAVSPRMALTQTLPSAASRTKGYSAGRGEPSFPGDYLKRSAKISR